MTTARIPYWKSDSVQVWVKADIIYVYNHLDVPITLDTMDAL